MGDKKSRIVNFRLPSEVHQNWKSQAESAGISMSDFVRSCVDSKQVTGIASPLKKRRHPAFSKVDPALLREIAKIGNNLNQLARCVNRYKDGVQVVLLTAHLKAIQHELEQLMPVDRAGAASAD